MHIVSKSTSLSKSKFKEKIINKQKTRKISTTFLRKKYKKNHALLVR